VRDRVLVLILRASRAFSPSPLPLQAWCSFMRGFGGNPSVCIWGCIFGGTRWWLWLWISYYFWWLPSPRRLVICWLVRGFSDCVRPQSMCLWGVLVPSPWKIRKDNSSKLFVSLSYPHLWVGSCDDQLLG
jgi:hypothetical protein